MGDWSRWFEVLIPLVASAILGGILGLERELRKHAAGLRTHMLVSMGCAVFALLGVEITKNSPAEISRVIQGIAAGVGFIGAGTILKLDEQGKVKGLTTASSIWLAAGVGTAAGLQLYPLAVLTTVFALLILVPLDQVKRLPFLKDAEEAPAQREGRDEER